MNPVSYFGDTGKQVTEHPVGLVKLEATANASANSAYFVQIHDSAVVPAEGVAPLKSWPIAEVGYKEFKRGELRLSKGLYVCISSTAATKTLAVGVNDKFDVLSLELFDPDKPTGTSFSGDETNDQVSITPWVTASGPKKLIEVVVNDTEAFLADDCFLVLFPDDETATGVPLKSFQVRAGVRNVFNFGLDGIEPRQIKSGVEYVGCFLGLSTSAEVFDDVGTGCPIKAEYK